MKTKKLLKALGALALFSSLVWGGVSCKQQTTDPQILVVNFDSDGGSEVTKQEVKVGDKATKPEDPTKEGYTFVAWKNGEEVYDFEKEVTSNLNLKAEWKAVENTGDSGSTGGESGSTGGESGSTGGESGSTGGESGSTGGESGSTGGESGSTGGESGSTGGESGSTGEEEKPAEVTPKPFTISYNGKLYSAGTFATADDWVSIEFEFETIPEEVQICVVSDSVEKEQSWGTQYYSSYIAIEDTKISVNLAEQVTAIGNGATKITGVNLQAKTTTAPDLKVKGAIVTKKDGTKEAVVAVKDWATEVTEN